MALILEPLSKEEIGRALTKMKEELKNLEIQILRLPAASA